MSDVYPATPLGSPVTMTPGQAACTAYVGASPELTAAMAETRVVRDGYAQLCDYFSPSPQSGMSARISLTMLNRHRVKAGLTELSRHDARDRPDPLMKALDDLDAAEAERDHLLGELTAARAVLAEQRTIRDRLAAERDAARETLATTQAIARMLQELAIEVIAAYASQVSCDETPRDRSRVAGWRKRAGLDDSAGLGDGTT